MSEGGIFFTLHKNNDPASCLISYSLVQASSRTLFFPVLFFLETKRRQAVIEISGFSAKKNQVVRMSIVNMKEFSPEVCRHFSFTAAKTVVVTLVKLHRQTRVSS